MIQVTPKLLILAVTSAISVVIMIMMIAQVVHIEEPAGLPAGTWTALGPAEAVPDAPSTQAGRTQLGDLASFVVEPLPQEGPFVNLRLTFRDGKNIIIPASSEMQAGYLQTTLMSTGGLRVPVTFRRQSNSLAVEVTDGQMLARFAQ